MIWQRKQKFISCILRVYFLSLSFSLRKTFDGREATTTDPRIILMEANLSPKGSCLPLTYALWYFSFRKIMNVFYQKVRILASRPTKIIF